MAEGRGFEPLRPGSQDITVFKTGAISRSANLPKKSGRDTRIRTSDLLLPKQLLQGLLTLFSRDALQKYGDGCEERCEGRGGSTSEQRDETDAPYFCNLRGRVLLIWQKRRSVSLRRPCGARTTASVAPNCASKTGPPHSGK
jgi:hypothetical protein